MANVPSPRPDRAFSRSPACETQNFSAGVNARPHCSQRGSLLLYLVIALVAFGLLAGAMTSFFSASQVGTAKVNCPRQAQYLAESGVRYAMAQLRAASQTSLAQFNATLAALQATTYTVDDSGTYTLTIADASPQYTVTATGTSCADQGGVTATAGPTTFTVNGAFCPGCGGGADPDTITFEPDADGNSDVDKFPPAGTGGPDGDDMVQINEDDDTLNLGNGGGESYGCAWYTGSKNPCDDGTCEFGSGLRAYFEIMLSPDSSGDGFTFAIVNAYQPNNGWEARNSLNDCGGDTRMGELLGYAGPGNTTHGLVAPKMALEFDTYANTGTGNQCQPSSRNDRTTADHLAWIFWGLPDWSNNCRESYDDNRHGSGVWSGQDGTPPNANMPTNPEDIGESGAGQDGFYYESVDNWIHSYNSSNTGKKFRIRIEIDRATTANADGNYGYILQGWIVRDSEDMPEGMDDVSTEYYDPDDDSTWPQIEHMVVFDSTTHHKLDNIYFGWTVGTGAVTEDITISNLRLKFKENATSCPAQSKPTDGLVFGLPLYEGQGGNTHNTAKGTAAYANYSYWLKGRSCPGCASLYFDDAYGPLVYWDDATQSMTTEGTVSAWVYLKDYDNYMGILHKGNDDNFGDEAFSLQFTRSNFWVDDGSWRFNPDRITHGGTRYRIDNGEKKPLFCVNNSGTSYCVNSEYELDLDTWYHLAATWDSVTNEMQFFVNGALTATFDADDYGWNFNAVSSAWNELVIGAQTANLYSFQGMVDDVYLYDRVLDDDEIMTLYEDGFLIPREQ